MSAMTVGEAEFVEGSIDLAHPEVWFCIVHEATVKTGKDCMFCLHDQLGEDGFERWLRTHGR